MDRPCRYPAERMLPTFFFDVVDPASYVVSALLESAGAADCVQWRGLEIRPPPDPPMDPAGGAWRRRSESVAQLLDHVDAPCASASLESPPFIPWSRKAHELAEFARDSGGGDCYHAVRHALYKAFFVDRRDVGRIDVLVDIGVRAGLERALVRVVLDVDRYTQAVLDHRSVAAELGVAGAPALVLGQDRVQGLVTVADMARWKRLIADIRSTVERSRSGAAGRGPQVPRTAT